MQKNENRRTRSMLLLSLSIGLTAYMLISAKVFYHHSFDTYLPGYKNIYRVKSSAFTGNTLMISQPRTQRALGQTLEEVYPEVLRSGYICGTIQDHYKIGDNAFISDRGFHCSENFLEIFAVEIRQGNPEGQLTQPNTVIVSESFAKKHFGDEDPVGAFIHQYPTQMFAIEAVYKDFPENSHIRPEFLISFHDNMHLPPPVKEGWGEFVFYTYLELDEHADLNKLEKEITQVCNEHNQTLLKESNSHYTFGLQSIRDIHTKSQLKNEISLNIRGDYLQVLQLISIFILVISGFNYVYFSYTRISRNAVQFGIRKVFGANNSSLLRQFLLESLMIHMLALILSVVIIVLLQQILTAVNKLFPFSQLPWSFWLYLLVVFSASSLLNPLVLIIMLQKKSPLALLTSKFEDRQPSFSFRQIFTILQFVIIVALLSSTAGIRRQLHFMKSMDIGISLEDKLVIKSPSQMRRSSNRVMNLDSYEQELTKIPGVRNVSISNAVPGDVGTFAFSASEQLDMNGVKTALVIADNHFCESFRVEIIAGEDFSKRRDSVCIVNSVCMKQLGYADPGDILGRKLYLQDESGMQTIETEVIGVCREFNFTNAKDAPDPLVLMDWTREILWENYTLTLSPNTDIKALLSRVESQFSATFPNYPFEYFWLEDYYNQQFDEENSIIRGMMWFVLLAIILAILSLLSMSWHMSQARTKEIGIRKVNGASQFDIIRLLNLYFIKWIGIASCIAIPLAWYFLSQWLKDFAYRANMSIWVFLIPAGFALIIGIITVTLQSFKVANLNPAESLKSD